MVIMSPFLSVASCTRSPLTEVPFELLRSRTVRLSCTSSKRACWRESNLSMSTTLLYSLLRPMVRGSVLVNSQTEPSPRFLQIKRTFIAIDLYLFTIINYCTANIGARQRSQSLPLFNNRQAADLLLHHDGSGLSHRVGW